VVLGVKAAFALDEVLDLSEDLCVRPLGCDLVAQSSRHFLVVTGRPGQLSTLHDVSHDVSRLTFCKKCMCRYQSAHSVPSCTLVLAQHR
jgi:hypothetical protein